MEQLSPRYQWQSNELISTLIDQQTGFELAHVVRVSSVRRSAEERWEVSFPAARDHSAQVSSREIGESLAETYLGIPRATPA
jgi:hypothetical protein